MSKLNTTIYRKLLACAQEAEEQGMIKLANNLKEVIGDAPAIEQEPYSYSEMENDVHRAMWKITSHLARYWDVKRMDVQKLDNSILILAAEIIDEVEHSLGVDTTSKGPLEPTIPGENK